MTCFLKFQIFKVLEEIKILKLLSCCSYFAHQLEIEMKKKKIQFLKFQSEILLNFQVGSKSHIQKNNSHWQCQKFQILNESRIKTIHSDGRSMKSALRFIVMAASRSRRARTGPRRISTKCVQRRRPRRRRLHSIFTISGHRRCRCHWDGGVSHVGVTSTCVRTEGENDTIWLAAIEFLPGPGMPCVHVGVTWRLGPMGELVHVNEGHSKSRRHGVVMPWRLLPVTSWCLRHAMKKTRRRR